MNNKWSAVLAATFVLSGIAVAQDKRAFFTRQIASYPSLEVWDTFPSWISNDDLLFYTSRNIRDSRKTTLDSELKSESSDERVDGLALYSSASHNDRVKLLLKMPGSGMAPAWSQQGRKIAFCSQTRVGLLYPDEAVVSAVNPSRVFRFDASWSPDGRHLAMSGTHSPSDMSDKNYDYDQDIFVSEIKQKPGPAPLLKNRCIVRLRGTDKLPHISPDGKWVYFAHQDPIKPFDGVTGSVEDLLLRSRKNWSLYRAYAHKSWNKGNIPQKIVGGLSEPDRLSFFPGGRKILLSFDNQIRGEAEQGVVAIVDIDKKSITPHKLKRFTERDQSGAKPLIPCQVTLSPSGKKLAFSAMVWSGKNLDSGWIYSYTCNFDGTNLTRISPLGNSEIPSFKYSNPNLTPLNAWDRAFNLR